MSISQELTQTLSALTSSSTPNASNQTKDDNPKSDSSVPPTAPRNTPCQGEVSVDKNANIRRAFLSERAATDFLSSHGRIPRLASLVHEIGAHVDELTSARRTYLQRIEEMDARLSDLARFCPRTPSRNEIFTHIQKINSSPLRPHPNISQPTPNRHESLTRSTFQPHHSTTSTPPIQLPQSHGLASPYA